MKIFLDDDPVRDSWVDDTWVIARSGGEVMALLLENKVEELSLDHDLGEFVEEVEITGATVASAIEAFAYHKMWEYVPDKITIHSANPVGRKNMQAAIDSIERFRNASDNELRTKLRDKCKSDTCQGCEYCAMLQSKESIERSLND